MTPASSTSLGADGGGAKTHGWGVSLRFRGRPLVERSVRDPAPLRIGEDPACTLVVPGLGDASTLANADRLHAVPGLTGVVHRGAGQGSEPMGRELTLAPGDHASFGFVDHPEITLELRRETYPRLPLSTLINLRELAQQLMLGAGLVAGLILLVRHEAPVNTLEVKGDPDAPEESALVRAMFAVEVPPIELRYHQLWAPIPAPAPAVVGPVEPIAVEPEAAPIPMLVEAEAVPVPSAPADAQPRKRKKRGEALEMQMLSALVASDDDSLGGVVGGVLSDGVGNDLLAELRSDAPLAAGTGGYGEGIVPTDEAVVEVVEEKVVDLVGAIADVEVVEPVEFMENIMGPGVPDAAPPDAVPVPKDIPTPPGMNRYPIDGTAVVTRGVIDGLAAAAPESRCEDPALVRQSQLDVVFVLDVSTTMTFMLDRIEKQIAQVDLETRAQGLDTRYGLVVFVDDIKLGNAGKPYADLAALQAELATWRAFTAGNRQINSPDLNLDWPENTLDAVHAAATEFAWRPADTTLRMIVHATDDDFGEAPAIQSGQPVKHGYAAT
ncbi:MAG TPA: vWA domain-containing protein, partial [Nannocystis sp.]